MDLLIDKMIHKGDELFMFNNEDPKLSSNTTKLL